MLESFVYVYCGGGGEHAGIAENERHLPERPGNTNSYVQSKQMDQLKTKPVSVGTDFDFGHFEVSCPIL